MALRSLALIVSVVLVVCGPAPGQCEPVLRGYTGGYATDTEIRGNLAFVANGWGGLLVVDIADPAAPSELARLNLPGAANGIAVIDGSAGDRLAYLAGWAETGEPGGGTYVVDISDPARPELIGTVGEPQAAWDVVIAGDRLYVCEGRAGISIYSLVDPRTPSLLGRAAPGGSARSLDIAGDLAFVAAFDAAMVIMDVSDPAATQIMGKIVIPQRPVSVVVGDAVAYLAADPASGSDRSMIWTVDISDPTRPTPIDYIDVRYPKRLALSGDRLYFANHIFGLKIYALDDPAHPALLGQIDLENACAVKVIGTTAYISDAWVGLVTIDVSDPGAPTVLGEYRQIRPTIRGVHTNGDVAYLDFFEIVDISDPTRPAMRAGLQDELWDLQIHGARAVAATRVGLSVLDLSDPLAPVTLGTGRPSDQGRARGVAMSGDIAFLCGPDDGFEILSFLRSFDISDPAQPRLLDEMITLASGHEVEVSGSTVYYANGRLQIVDASDPADLQVIYDPGGFNVVDLVVRDGLLYALGEALRIYDVEDPAAPVLLGELGIAGRNIVLDGDFAYIAAAASGVTVVDVRDPAAPVPVVTAPVPDRAWFVAISGDRLCVAALAESLQIYDISSCRCRPDLDGDGALTLFDFLEFQNLFAAGDLRADLDGDGALTLFDFLMFQDLFDAGC